MNSKNYLYFNVENELFYLIYVILGREIHLKTSGGFSKSESLARGSQPGKFIFDGFHSQLPIFSYSADAYDVI